MKNPDKKNKTSQTAIKKERNNGRKTKNKNSESEKFCINIHNFGELGVLFSFIPVTVQYTCPRQRLILASGAYLFCILHCVTHVFVR